MGYEADFEATKGLWTPWADVLCYKCHGPNFREGKPIPDYEMLCTKAVMTPPEGSEVTTCMQCGKWIHVVQDVAALNNLRTKLPSWVGGVMEQTGGMCVAMRMTFIGYHYVVYSDDEDYCQVSVYYYQDPDDPSDVCDTVYKGSVNAADAILLAVVKHRLGK